ncbi:MFS transporter [Halorussus gelatinilyticus]|uniref:MFS transporter n=1 Tax=Halorussus gelatinilyticus TaxID=2937524 RepID=A0A8U0IGW4_9EURY|nr:MFS transporter [Halorussus gelatinilyticus]UPV99471.1 MFS transporter [Halorussus gelatinilyticus]
MTTAPEPPTRDSAAVPWRSPTVRVVFAATALAPLGVPLLSPALPVVREAFGLTDAATSLLISVYFLTGIVLSPFIGLLADRVGRKRVLVPSLVVFSLAGSAIALAPPFRAVLAVRLVQGTAAAGIFVTTVTLIGDAFEGVQRNAVLGVNTAVLASGAAVYPLLGGYLATISWNAPFVAYLLGLPVALFAWVALEETAVESATGRGSAYLRAAARTLARRAAVLPYGTALVTEVLLFGTVITAMPFLLVGTYGVSPVFVGGIITVTEAVSAGVAAANGRLAESLSDERIVALGYACYGVGLLVAWWAATLPALVAGVVVFGAGVGLTMPSVDALLSDLVTAKHRAGVLSLRNSVTFLGRAVGPVLFAGVAVETGYRPLLLAAGVAGLVGVAATLVLSENEQ